MIEACVEAEDYIHEESDVDNGLKHFEATSGVFVEAQPEGDHNALIEDSHEAYEIPQRSDQLVRLEDPPGFVDFAVSGDEMDVPIVKIVIGVRGCEVVQRELVRLHLLVMV